MNRAHLVLKETWEEYKRELLPILQENEKLYKASRESNSAIPLLFLDNDAHIQVKMRVIEDIAEKLGIGKYEKEFKWEE